jgi:hypothetical protein
MSYGVWRRRGKGWSSIEVDSPWNYDFYNLEERSESSFNVLKSNMKSQELSKMDCFDNPHIAQWMVGQRKKKRLIRELPTGGEHVLLYSFDMWDRDSEQKALEKLKDHYDIDEYEKLKEGGWV